MVSDSYNLRISEVYASTQGEGPRVGCPTIFVRFAGCNLRCPGWPCDTPHAIFPDEYRHEWQIMPFEKVVDMIEDASNRERHYTICYTGGEPFLQNHKALHELTNKLEARGYRTFEAFTNGTILYPTWAFELLHFIVDWKLKGSGEDPSNLTRLKNIQQLTVGDAVKFVIKDRDDFEQARRLWHSYLTSLPVRVYAGAVWDVMKSSELVEWVQEAGLPWWLNVQVHNYIWPAQERRR